MEASLILTRPERPKIILPVPGSLSFTIYGIPRTKKTSQKIIKVKKHHIIVPGKLTQDWTKNAQAQLPRIMRNLEANGSIFPIHGNVSVAAKFYRSRAVGDLNGFQQALGDLLGMKTGTRKAHTLMHLSLLEDDRLITSWDGSYLFVDKENPRIDVIINLEDIVTVPKSS